MLSSTRRAATVSARQLARRQPRRNASSHGHDSHHDAHHGPVTESFGKVFYGVIAFGAVSAAVYKYKTSDPDSTPFLTSLIDSWSYAEEFWTKRNSLHAAALEQAAYDRHLFMSDKQPSVFVDLRFPEIFNNGSPFNVKPGAFTDISKVTAHYEERARKLEEERVAKMKESSS